MTTDKSMSEHSSPSTLASRPSRAFTLVEMIVVTGIIAVLAALIFPVTAAVKKSRDLNRARTELMRVVHAIDGYKDKLGHFPPDNAANPLYSQLFYELCGTTAVASGGSITAFKSLDGSTSIPQGDVRAVFGADGFINCTRGGGDEAQPAQKFLLELKAGQYLDMTSSITPVTTPKPCRLLGCSLDGPNAVVDPVTSRKFNPWWYNYSSPTNGTAPYDLFVDVQVGNRIYRVSNWSTTPQVVK
jgi:prepilin-type N-terminal cleavage/methylation domain-containing protein